MPKYRTKFREDTDDLVYVSKDYVIFKKDANGTLFASFDLVKIGIAGIEQEPINVLTPEDHNEIIDDFIKDLLKQKR